MNRTTPKWLIADVITSGRQAKELSAKYFDEMLKRMKQAELDELNASVDALGSSKTGQSEKLVEQKTETKTKEQILKETHVKIVDLRGLIKAVANVTPEKLNAFGVGVVTNNNNVSQNVAAANMIIDSFEKYKAWAQEEAGMIEEDIEQLKTLRDQLKGADESQDKKVLERKVTTVDKNVLQQRVEELITKVSAVGVATFRTKQPSLVPLFEALIPGNGSSGSNDSHEESQPEPAASTTL